MPSYSTDTLEFSKLLRLVSRRCQTPMGRAHVESLGPFADLRSLRHELEILAEAFALRDERQSKWSFSGLEDPTESIAILKIRGAALEPLRALEIASVASQALGARALVSAERDIAPQIFALVETIPSLLADTVSKITGKILPGGDIDDSASPELARLRREINSQRTRLQRTLESSMRTAGDAIQDPIVTVRNGRYVIPVKADFKGAVTGVAHGFSSSGATVFIEPLDVIDANNELQSLKGKEEREVARILFAITEQLREELPAIEAAVEAVTHLDAVRAKLEFASDFDAVTPVVSEDHELEFKDARHPLLEENLRDAGAGDAVVPVAFTLSKARPVMVISGANAGGKTVVMKTAGLLSLMSLSGLPVPAKSARIPFYRSVLADIGDHQSLAANLSTFSSHISNIADMMRVCDAPSLVLLDEVGTGTDPDEGSALGVAIVDHFRRTCGAHVIASTHYRGLKQYAANDEGVVNASVEFNERTLEPTYRLLTGMSGASSGIEIARRFGILDGVIENAKENLDESARTANEFLAKLQAEVRAAEQLRVALEEEREATAEKFANLESDAEKREADRKREFERELASAIAEFDRQAKSFIDGLEDKALKARLDKERVERKSELNQAILDRTGQKKSASGVRAPVEKEEGEIGVGSHVLTKLGQRGIVREINKGVAEVTVGRLRLREKISNLQKIAPAASEPSKRRSSDHGTVRTDPGVGDSIGELNLIGKTVAEAEDELDKFLDHAYLQGLTRVRIIHGFGTGTLRNFVHHVLKGHPHIRSFGFAPQDQGGNGATIAEMNL